MFETRTIRAVIEFDLGLHPVHYSTYLRDDGDLVDEHFDHFGAFTDAPECMDQVMVKLAERLVEMGWWS